ncbi:MAG: hypothetical protein EBU07_19785, partial [Betaproteobacteria bacterium]|nr:hypothetical protein [Betaproteobacteria bacterium]
LRTAIDRLSAEVDEGSLVFTDLDSEGDTVQGLTIDLLATLDGSVSVEAAGALVVSRAAGAREAGRIQAGAGGSIALRAGANLSLLDSEALLALEGSISELTLVAAGFLTSARLFTGALRTEYRAGQPLRLGSAARYVDPVTGEITEGAVILPDDSVNDEAVAPQARVAFAMLASDEPGASEGDLDALAAEPMMAVRSFAAAAPAGLLFASDAFISLADPLPQAEGGITVTASEAVFVVDPALLEGVQVATQRFLVMPIEAIDAGNEEQTLSDLTDTEEELPPVITPVGVLPGGIIVTPDVDSALVFPGAGDSGAFGAGDSALTLTLKVPVSAGVLRATATAANSAAPVLVTGSGTATLTLSGT